MNSYSYPINCLENLMKIISYIDDIRRYIRRTRKKHKSCMMRIQTKSPMRLLTLDFNIIDQLIAD